MARFPFWALGSLIAVACGGRVEIGPAFETVEASGGAPWLDAPLYPADESPLGLSHPEWLGRYWQWHMALPFRGHPREGGSCDQGQAEDLWFLTTGQNGEVQFRDCTIPEGRPIGVLLNAALFYPSPDCLGCGESEASLEVWTSNLTAQVERTRERIQQNVAYLEIDSEVYDVDSDYYWEATSPFSIDVPAGDPYFTCSGPIEQNVCGWAAGDSRPFASLGYLAIVRPPPVGTHVLRLGAKSSDGRWLTDVTYTLEIVPSP